MHGDMVTWWFSDEYGWAAESDLQQRRRSSDMHNHEEINCVVFPGKTRPPLKEP